jgi:hypothetical protein
MAIQGSTTNANGDTLLISLQEPYLNVIEVLSYEDVIEGETTDCFYNKSFRWGIDGVSYSDWVPLTNANLEALLLEPNNPFWIQYKYEQVGDCTLEFISVSLELVTDSGTICKVPQVSCCDGQLLSGAQNLVIDCCSTKWNPYDLSRAAQMYQMLSSVASNLFGFCVKYFKTSADQRSRDVILKEYSLYNVIKSAEVKIMFPDNELPTRELQFNPLMIDYPVQFEVHIVKSAFEAVFGIGSKPEVRDYLYLENYMNKMYEIDGVSQSDDFLYTGSYWRVSLVAYQNRTAVLFTDKNIEEERDDLISSVGTKFEEEANNEYDDVRKPNQYNTIGTLANDYVRRILDKKLIIKEENVYNNWTIISKYHYNLASMILGSEAVEYRYNQGFSTADSRSFTFWLRPLYKNPVGQNILILSISDDNGFASLNLTTLPTDPNQKLKVGDWISVSGTQSYNGIHKIIEINGNSLVIDELYTDGTLLATPKVNREKSCTFIEYAGQNTQYLEFTYTYKWFVIKINGIYYKYNVYQNSLSFNENQWYAVVINLNNLSRQLSLFVYETVELTGSINPNRTSELYLAFLETKSILPISIPNGNSWRLLGSATDLTNIRIWSKPIEEEQQSLILSQYVVNDTHLTLLVDNASPQLLLSRTTNPR